MTEPQRIQTRPVAVPATRTLTAQDQARSLLRDARDLLGRSVEREGTPAERMTAYDALTARASRLPEAGVRAETAERLRSVFAQLQDATRADAVAAGVDRLQWMMSTGGMRPGGMRPGRFASARQRRVSRAARQALAGLGDAVRHAPDAAQHGRTGLGADGLTREIVAHLDVTALAANFTRAQLMRAATQAGARPHLAEQLVNDVAAEATRELTSSMVDVAQERLRDLSAHLRRSARSPEALVDGLIAAPMPGLQLLHELGVPGDELQRLSADINRLNEPNSAQNGREREALRAQIMGRAMGLADDASRSAARAAEELGELRQEDPDRILATFPWATKEAARSLSIDHSTAARITHGGDTGSLLARTVYGRREGIESHDRWLNMGIKATIILAQIATSAVAGPLAGALVGSVGNAANGLREVAHARELARLTQGAAATGLNSHATGRAARREADATETAAVVDVGISAASGLSTANEIATGARSGAAHFELREAATEALREADTALAIEDVKDFYLHHAEEADHERD